MSGASPAPEGRIRRAGARDLAPLVALWRDLALHHAPLDPLYTLHEDADRAIEALWRAQLADADGAVLVWEEGSGIRGVCAARVDRAPPIFRETRRLTIADLVVAASHRRRGIGRRLAEAMLGWGRERGLARAEVRVVARNAEGRAFWRALGFEPLVDVLQRRL